MRSKLNPDGSKIRSMRIQRGWTQDQLAGIAGISPRTIQRAESADSAAFETVRAIAGAFETDFEQLLKPDTGPNTNTERESNPAAGIEPIEISRPKSGLRWAIPLTALSILLLGIATGLVLAPRREMGLKSDPRTTPAISAAAPRVERSERTPLSEYASLRSQPKKRSPFEENPSANPHRKPDLKESHGETTSRTPAPNPSDPAIGDIGGHSQAAISLHDSLPQSQDQLPTLPISESRLFLSSIPIPAVNPISNEPDSGALKEAMNTAAKKTGAFVSKAGESIKRVF